MDYLTLATAALSFLKNVAPHITKSETIQKGLDLVETLIPAGTQYTEEIIPVVKDIIDTFRGNKVSTAEQLDQMDKLDERCDKIFDEALEAARKADAENSKS